MEDVTVIIQGRLLKDSYDFYIKNYTKCKVIISTWINTDIDFTNLPNNFIVLLSPIPNELGAQNLNLQLISTLNGLEMVTTPFVIKVRGDEYWSNIESVYQKIKSSPRKIHSSSVFFRAWQYAEYHISDHLVAGTIDNMKIMFSETKRNFDNGKMNTSSWKIDGKFHKLVNTHAPEERITKSYLSVKEPQRFGKVDGRIIMKEHFDIINIDVLKPYKIKANLFGKEWTDGFIPERNFSISTIDQLFSDEPYKIPE
jgi:hypothetical protein